MARSTLLLIAIGIVFVVAVAAAAAVVAIRGGEDELPDGSPERVVQLYLRAVEDHDATEAFSYLSPGLAERCTTSRDMITQRANASIRATLEEATVEGSSATVRVELTETFNNAPFGQSDPRQKLVFDLELVDGRWLFSESPWPLYCMLKAP